MRLKPRNYQDYALKCLWHFLRTKPGKYPVIAMPTGTGKSPIPAWFAVECLKIQPQTKILVVTDVKELIAQNYDKFTQIWPNGPAGVYSAGLDRREYERNVTYAGIGSIAKKAHLFGRVDVVIVDECHKINPKESTMYMKLFTALKKINPNVIIVGMTATPYRPGLGSIASDEPDTLFDEICCDMTTMEAFNWFVSEGYLCPLLSPKSGFVLDVTGVNIQKGDYDAGKLELAVNKRDITLRAFHRTMEIAHDRKSWLVFASGIQHCHDIVEILDTVFGIEAIAVYNGMGDDARDKAIEDFKAGRVRVLVNNNILTTGFDHPGLDLIVCLRPTTSVNLWVQMLGRGTRPLFIDGFDLSAKEGRLASIAASGKHNTMVLDFAGNAKKLGPVNDPVKPRKKGQGKGEAPVKDCPVCETQNHASARYCGGAPAPLQLKGYCGAEFSFAVKIQASESHTPVMATALPVVEVLKVDMIQYHVNRSVRSQYPNLKISYVCGATNIAEVVCFDHPAGNFARARAESWWRKRSNSPVPTSSDEANEFIEQEGIATPTHIRVRLDQKYPEVLACCYDGTAFGTLARPSNDDDIPLDMVPKVTHTTATEDIPF